MINYLFNKTGKKERRTDRQTKIIDGRKTVKVVRDNFYFHT